MKMSLRTLSGMRAGRRIAVLGAMAELGKRRRELHRKVGEEAARCGIDLLVTVGAEAEAYSEGARRWAQSRGRRPLRCVPARNAGECAGMLTGLLQKGDVVLFKASRTARLEELVRMMRKTD
jgi:UDP-N-acetylmuramoyl-tripeptide--D-alanyl-D-alanine ligase